MKLPLDLNKRIFLIILNQLKKLNLHFFLYKSYLIQKFNRKKIIKKKKKNYITIMPNSGAGIGHQLANYNSAIWYSKKFNLVHAHTSFNDKSWEKFFGFYENIITSNELISKGYIKIQLPFFKEKLQEIKKIKKIIEYFSDQKVIFFLEKDQPYTNQFQVSNYIKFFFYKSKKRRREKVIYKKKNFNIAIHVRQGDILNNKKLYKQRNLGSNFYKIVKNKIQKLKEKNIKIHIFTQGKLSKKILDIDESIKCNFNKYKTFLHLIKADLLVTSKSSFSYKAALFSKNKIISPRDFWHNYPKLKRWFLI